MTQFQENAWTDRRTEGQMEERKDRLGVENGNHFAHASYVKLTCSMLVFMKKCVEFAKYFNILHSYVT